MVSCEIHCANCHKPFETWGGGNLCIPCTKLIVEPAFWPPALLAAERGDGRLELLFPGV